jgi:hypothetical protein
VKPQLQKILLAGAMINVAACSTTPLTTTLQPTALDYATKRARFEMNCPTATASVLSSETLQPVLNGPLMMGTERAQYTIGVQGCGQRETLVAICAQGGNGCFAADGSR